MKNKIFFFWCICVFFGPMPTNANAETDSASNAGDAQITLVSNLTLVDGANGGRITFPNAAPGMGSQTVAPSNAAAAGFNVTGPNNQQLTITLPASASMTNGANSIGVNSFTAGAGLTGIFTSPNILTLSATGAGDFKVGASHDIIPNTHPAGVYNGPFTVTVSY